LSHTFDGRFGIFWWRSGSNPNGNLLIHIIFISFFIFLFLKFFKLNQSPNEISWSNSRNKTNQVVLK
jgi:hypothetical protein